MDERRRDTRNGRKDTKICFFDSTRFDHKNSIKIYLKYIEFTDLESDHNQTQSLLNTDAVYLTTFAALSFCHRSRDADEPDRACFFGQVWGSGCIVYGNENWLNAIYDILVTHNLFDQVGEIDNESALIRLIEDYDGHNKKYLSTFIEDKVEVIKDEKYINCEFYNKI